MARSVPRLQKARPALVRYELKYRIPRDLVPEIRRAIRVWCDPDREGGGGPYRISSLYLDSPSRILYRQSRERSPRRLKLRARRYANGPLFVEIKQRNGRVCTKKRIGIDPKDWPGVLLDPGRLDELDLAPSDRETIEEFVNRALLLRAEPTVVVRYLREAFVSRTDHYARATFDSQLEGLAPRGFEVPIEPEAGWVPFDDAERLGMRSPGMVLELKCTEAVPYWMTDLVRRFGLRSMGFSKFATAIESVANLPANRDAGLLPNRRLEL